MDEIGDLSEKISLILVGSTGCGKSSITNLFCGSVAKVSTATESCTTKVTPYLSEHKDIVFIDTVGMEDSTGKTDKDITIEIINSLIKYKVQSAKIIWCVRPSNRATDTLKRQANFINSLAKDWNSVLLIISQGRKHSDSNGATAAAKASGCPPNYNIPVISATCINWLPKEEIEQDGINNLSDSEKIKNGYITSKEFKDQISKETSKLSSVKIIPDDTKCENCAWVGDRRCAPLKCHSKKTTIHVEKSLIHLKPLIPFHDKKISSIHVGQFAATKFHPKNQERYHPEKLVKTFYHQKGKIPYHPTSYTRRHGEKWGVIQSFHSGNLVEYHTEGKRGEKCHWGDQEWYHPREWDSHAGRRVFVGIITAAISEFFARGDYPCCGRENKRDQGCQQRYKCCKNPLNSNGCTIKYYYSCCYGDEYSSGCKYRYDCCKLPSGSEGCQKKAGYPCCLNEDYGSVGCMFMYDCCGKMTSFRDNGGCKWKYECCDNEQGCKFESAYSCCNKDGKDPGCKYRWTCCNRLPDSEGCQSKSAYTCCSNQINSPGCQKKFPCCEVVLKMHEKEEDVPGCQKKYACCNSVPESQGCSYKCCKRPMNSDGCKIVCQNCHKNWGTPGGCVIDGKHTLVKL